MEKYRVYFGMRFSEHGRRAVLGAFDGGEITSDAGSLLLREVARRLDLFGRMAGCFEDRRDPDRVRHQLPDLLAQRVLGIALGYEDINDHDRLRHDPLLKVTAAAKPESGGPLPALAGSSTLGRLERSFEECDRRYHDLVAHPARLQDLYVDLFTASYDTAPERIILDIDATDIETHGQQAGGFFHGYYEHRCFLPLYIYCGPHLLLSKLRHGNVDGAEGAKSALKRVVGNIRRHWPQVGILVRGDSGFARTNLMNWCEANGVDYIFGLPRNDYLLHKARKVRSRAAVDFMATGKTAAVFGHFYHMTRSGSWNKPRHVIAKVLHLSGQDQRCRFLVTSLDWNSPEVLDAMRQARDAPENQANTLPKDLLARVIYEAIYCPRGDMENRIKDCQLDLFGHRTSAHAFKTNQTRLILAGFAYVLMTQLRLMALTTTTLAKAAPDTIRQKLLKIGARVTVSVRRIKISMPDACPVQAIFFTAWRCLVPL
ncbi:IS1380 family transposase [Azospirillum fermentarium]|uniref:IS1380 family transposase n=1 Tax=Azospirillum fermentarium TaxID=1233114 RepID=UPI003872DD14